MIIVIIISTLCSVSASVLFLITHCTSPWVRFQPNDLLCVATENWQRNGKKQQQNIESKQFESNAFSFNEFSNWIDSVRVASSSLLLLYRIFHLEHQSFGRLFQNALAKCAMPIRWQLFFCFYIMHRDDFFSRCCCCCCLLLLLLGPIILLSLRIRDFVVQPKNLDQTAWKYDHFRHFQCRKSYFFRSNSIGFPLEIPQCNSIDAGNNKNHQHTHTHTYCELSQTFVFHLLLSIISEKFSLYIHIYNRLCAPIS